MLETVKQYLARAAMVALVVVVAVGYWKYRSYESELARLRNEAAAKDKTTEELKNTYTKLVSENDGLKSSNKDLQKLLDRTNQKLIAEIQSTVYWKGKYEFVLTHGAGADGGFKPPAEQAACTDKPKTYTAVQDIGILEITVETFTVDPSYQQKLLVGPGNKPLKLTLDLTRDAHRQWHTHVVSSDERIGVDIGINSVNTEALDLRWYEKLKFRLDVGAGPGVLFGAGASYQFGKFDLGPSVWGTTNGGVKPFYGISATYAPFKAD